MACKLYYQTPDHTTHAQTFSSRDAAERFWKLMKENVCKLYACEVKPIFVETGKIKGTPKGTKKL